MIEKTETEKLNLSVLGILIRVTRIKQGYSLRNLSALTNISHTLISNIEKGKQHPSEATLTDIFNVLKLKLYTSKSIAVEMSFFYKNILKNLIDHKYNEAKELVNQMEENGHKYEFSYELVNYHIVRCLYYTLTDNFSEGKDEILKQYVKVIDFFTNEQKQLFYFIIGLDHLNNNHYKLASSYFENALKLGNKEIDVVIKEYLVKSYIKQYKFTDSVSIAEQTIEEFEEKTNYERAMKCRLSTACVYMKILKLDKAQILIDYVNSFANQFHIEVLMDDCCIINSEIMFFKGEYLSAIEELDKHTNQDSKHLILPKFRAYLMGKDERLNDYYINVMKTKKNIIMINEYLLIKVLMMWINLEFRIDEEYVESLNELIEFSVEANDQEIIGLAYNLLIEFYKKKRKYKKALDISDALLMNKKIHLSFYSIKND